VLYAIHVPTARTPTSGLELERIPSREEAGRCLLTRCQLGSGHTWFVSDSDRDRWPRPVRQWEDADETGYMRVFLRKARDPVPRLTDTPQEEWLVNPGGRRGIVVRLPWEASDGEVIRVGKDGLRVLPAGTAPALALAARARAPRAKTATPALVAPPRAVCGSCFQERHPTAGCGCPDTGADLLMEMQRPTRDGWTVCPGCEKAVSAYARCGCS
jgi:hypothetical protein